MHLMQPYSGLANEPATRPSRVLSLNIYHLKVTSGELRQNEQIYNIFDTTKLLDRPPQVAITDKSGVDGVALWVNGFFNLKSENSISKIKISKVAKWVMDQYDLNGRLSTITDEELAKKVEELLPEYYAKYHNNIR